MILPLEQLKEILDGMEQMLMPALEETTKIKKVSGATMIKAGDKEYQTPGGILLPVNPAKKYLYKVSVQVPVNHRRRIRRIIEDAKDEIEMNEKLGEYLFKFG